MIRREVGFSQSDIDYGNSNNIEMIVIDYVGTEGDDGKYYILCTFIDDEMRTRIFVTSTDASNISSDKFVSIYEGVFLFCPTWSASREIKLSNYNITDGTSTSIALPLSYEKGKLYGMGIKYFNEAISSKDDLVIFQALKKSVEYLSLKES